MPPTKDRLLSKYKVELAILTGGLVAALIGVGVVIYETEPAPCDWRVSPVRLIEEYVERLANPWITPVKVFAWPCGRNRDLSRDLWW